jgi:hypothetical protein
MPLHHKRPRGEGNCAEDPREDRSAFRARGGPLPRALCRRNGRDRRALGSTMRVPIVVATADERLTRRVRARSHHHRDRVRRLRSHEPQRATGDRVLPDPSEPVRAARRVEQALASKRCQSTALPIDGADITDCDHAHAAPVAPPLRLGVAATRTPECRAMVDILVNVVACNAMISVEREEVDRADGDPSKFACPRRSKTSPARPSDARGRIVRSRQH